jgi:hypothetical protein
MATKKFNGPASEYAPPHTMTDKPVGPDAGVHYMTDPNTMKADESMPGGMPARRVSLGNITFEPKSTGIETRGNGCATKGRIARGPMA